MAEQCQKADTPMKLNSIPLKGSNSVNNADGLVLDTSRYMPPKSFFSPTDRPNTAMDFTNHHKLTNFAGIKEQFRPQTSMGARPTNGGGPTAGTPPGAAQPTAAPPHVSRARQRRPALATAGGAQHRRKHYPRRKAHIRRPRHIVRSRELRASRHLVGCDCVKLNGLQGDCRRRECHTWFGKPNPDCAPPTPACGPSPYGNAAHLQAIVDAARERHRIWLMETP